MPGKRSQKTDLSAVALALSQDDMILMETKFALFIQQVDKEAQGRMDELESRMETSLAMVDKYYHIELMKTPPPLQKMQLKDLMNGLSVKEFFDRVETGSFSNPSDVSIAVKSEADSSFTTPPLTSSSLRRVKSAVSRQKAEAPTPKASKGGKLRGLVSSQSTGSLRTKTRSCVAKQSDLTHPGPHLRSRSVSAAGDLQLTMCSSQGKKICLTEENVEDMDLSELSGAVEQIQKLKRVIDFLAGKLNLPQK